MLLPARGEDAAATWKRLAQHWKTQQAGGQTLLTTQIPSRGTVALLRRGNDLIGASGVGDVGQTAALLRALK